jgi:hypothetical protein
VFAHRHFSRTGLEAMRAAACAGAVCAGAVCASAVVPALAIVLAGPVAFAQTTTAQTPPPALTPKEAARGPQVTYVTKAAEEPVPAVEDCGLGASQVRPKSLVLTCADANDLAKDLRWSSWGPTGAYGRGVDTWNACEPYCAASKTWYSTTATFTLTQPVHTSKGWLFERLTVRITGPTAQKVERVIAFSEAPVPDS